MATFAREEILQGLRRLGQLAMEQGESIELLLLGGAVMVLVYATRESTRDVDAVVMRPAQTARVRDLAARVAAERDWPEDWLNDAAKGYLVRLSPGPVVLSAPGIEVRRLGTAQLLAMKLCAWRDDVDIADARRLLEDLAEGASREQVWEALEPYLTPGSELKAQYGFADLWEAPHGNDRTTR